ncbi:oxidoreductase [Alphaproteobacteria bacterium GH1-50]|uniref:Oxidoreductase n=1 Tax=Kangsaoukella pontilimi TaxID=2691042 RepID=A0A7C9IEQ6_9RHOB|nr:aldo/keto reductase [Kangsaoukella pontilimi]MXQ06807.1 oxidoreductase [Kangsaoukella pontilimi]
MDRVKITDTVSFSRIVYGMWRLDEDDTSPAHIRAKIDACLEQGITTIDQANIYGGYTAEGYLGGALKEDPSLRDKIELVSKCDIVAPVGRFEDARVKHYDTSAAHIASQIDQSLADMGTDYLDLLLIHRPDPLMDHHETGRALDDAVKSGKVRAVGVSNFKPWDFTLLQSAMETPLATNQIELSLSAHSAFTNGDVAFAQERGLPLMAWSPLGGGSLVGKKSAGDLSATLDRVAEANGTDTAAVAIAWLLAHPSGILPVMGTNKIARIKAFSDAFKVGMDRQTWYELYTAALGHEVA